MNWEAAEKRVRDVLETYKSLAGMPGAMMGFGIAILESLLNRYSSGERTEDLYDAMMSAE
jgi:hypothetical protein